MVEILRKNALPVVLLVLGATLGTAVACRVVRVDPRQSRTLVIEVGIQNFNLAMVLALSILEKPEYLPFYEKLRDLSLPLLCHVGAEHAVPCPEPEDAHQLLYGATQRMCQSVVDYRGVVCRFMGDGVMAVFVPKEGADALEVRRRAVRCASDLVRALAAVNLELQAEGAEALEVRVGVAAGPLVQGKMGSDVRYEYTVIGDVVNLAARLESQARPGHVVVTSDVWNAFLDSPLPNVQLVGRQIISVKGKQQAVDVVELAVMHA